MNRSRLAPCEIHFSHIEAVSSHPAMYRPPSSATRFTTTFHPGELSVNATILLLASSMALGGDAPIVVSGTNCGGCGTPTVSTSCATPCQTMPSCHDACGPRLGLLAKIKARLASLKPNFGHCAKSCEPACAPAAPVCAPACETKACGTPLIRRPIFTGFTTCCADPCKVGLLDKLKAKFAGLHSCNACAAPAAPTCCGSSTAATTTVTVTVPAAPAAMPK
jgi:hypothetical protein